MVMSTMRTLSCTALLFFSLVLGACGVADPAGLGGLPLGERQAPPVEDQISWFRPASADIYCVVAPCPTYLLRGVNGAESRYVADVDLGGIGLPAAAAGELQPRLDTLLVQGRFRELELNGRPYLTFQVSRALEAVAPAAVDQPERDGYYAVQAGAGCPDDRCVTFAARPLGGGAEEVWTAVDLHLLQLPEAEELGVMLELRRGGLVLSRRAPSPSDAPMPVVATQAFRPLGPEGP
jgi:hypothetical protein